jgi:hypothetical protein
VKEGGKSLLHDQFGIPKLSKVPKKEVMPLKELPNQPIPVRAAVRETPVRMGHPGMKRDVVQPKAPVVQDEDDKFYPPKSNFVSVGQQEHTWHDESVTGLPTVDNNDTMDTDSLQGMNPLADADPEMSQVCQYFDKRLKHITEGIVSQLEDVQDLEDLAQLHKNVLSKTGVLGTLLRQFNKIPQNERAGVGHLINAFIEDINSKFQDKQNEFVQDEEEGQAEEEEYDRTHPDSEKKAEGEVEYQEDDPVDNDQMEDHADNSDAGVNLHNLSEVMQEGQYGILVQGSLVKVENSAVSAKQMLTTLVLNKGVDISTITLIKRVPVDFGIIVGD